ncbi:MAG: DUF4058 family protein [Gemmataceae bacterium]
MPLHDWTRVNAGLFHHFHQMWCCELSRALNRGPLPEGYTALVEQRAGTKEMDLLAIEEAAPTPLLQSSLAVMTRPQTKYVARSEQAYYADKASQVVIRHQLGRVVAFIEILSPANKHDAHSFESFCEKIVQSIRSRVHVLVIDLFPPGRRDPSGIHQAIWEHFEADEPFILPTSDSRVLASYEADGVNTAFIETPVLGEALSAMPLFIAPGGHVLVPLEPTYQVAWNDSPKSLRRLVDPSL